LSLGVFQDANIELIPNETPENPTVDLLYQLQEGFARSVRVGGGVSTELGLFGAVNYRDRNFRGIGEDINLGIQAGGRGLEFNTGYTSPYRDSRPNRLGYSVNGFRRSFQSLTFSDEVPLANGDDARERRFGGGASVMRPLGEWDAELGVDYARVSIRDEDGDIATEDSLGNALTASDSGIDDLLTVGFRVTQDRRLNPSNPAGGSILSFGTEQSIPIGSGNILLNRLTANYARYLPTDLLGSGNLRNPEVVAFNVRGGTVLGELPPYEAFDLGGAGSVRGYGGGDVGSGRSFILASAEYRFPLFSTLGGVLFTDFASDLGTGSSVEGDPAGSRDKPGTGFGYGVGLRFGSPIGLLRADFGFNDEGDNQFHFGFGQSF
ncbi:MAG: BamA/TamA family outer membrane protein, partial [Cyanobacteria bacterium P01_A01_bin.37]